MSMRLFSAFILLVVLVGCGGGGSVPPPPPPPPPAPPSAPSVSPSSATVPLGGTTNFTVTGNGSLTCTASQGTISLNGTTAIYTAPVTPPSGFPSNNGTVTISCVASSTAGQSSPSTASINLEFPVPTIASISPSSLVLDREAIVANINISGSGFYAGGVLSTSVFGDLVLAQGTAPNQILLNLGIGTDVWSPGWIDLSVSSPLGGPGGGTSSIAKLGFLGNQNSLACTQTECFQLDQGAKLVRRFRLTDGRERPGFVLSDLILSTGIALDNQSGQVTVAQLRGVNLIRKTFVYQALLFPPNTPFFGSLATDVTGQASWTTSDPMVAEGTSIEGQFAALDAGTATISACHQGICSAVEVHIVSPEIPTLRINPDIWSCNVGGTLQFEAYYFPQGLKALGTAGQQRVEATAAWNSSNLGILAPTSIGGQFQCTGSGFTKVRAEYNGVTAEAAVLVGPMLPVPALLLAPPSLYFPDFDIGGGVSIGKQVMAISVQDDRAVVSHDFDGQVSLVDLAQSPLQPLPVATGTEPWSVATAHLSGELVATVFDRAELKLTILRATDGQFLRSANLSNLTAGGHWQLAVFDSGPLASVAALLSQTDRVIVFVDLDTGQEIRRVNLSGVPFRIAADETTGSVIVADADAVAGVTRFVRIDGATGNTTALASTTNLLAIGLAVSRDGTNLYVAMRDQFQILPIN